MFLKNIISKKFKAHFLLTEELLELLLKTEESRVIHISSEGHKSGDINYDIL